MTFDYNTDVFSTLFRLVVKAPFNAARAVYKFYVCSKAEAELAGMDDHMLADIGVSRGEIHHKVWGI
ncbi:MAG TPA: DUF1127 domain-containing protein [Rhizobiales bacterium]|nr:DUF1127 domain-containing protein [Hyphomicrobiales bacterium]